MIARELVADVDLLCLDAGNTVIFLDHERLARVAVAAGFASVSAEALALSEGRAKLRADAGTLVDPIWSSSHAPGALAWGRVVATILSEAGAPDASLTMLVEAVWVEHTHLNMWARVPEGLLEALKDYRARGGKSAIVSNSEGALEPLLEALGVAAVVDMVIDSGRVGIEKPDPAHFQLALDRFAIPASRALHLGDTYSTVVGAQRAGIRVALIDPFAHYVGLYPDVPRVAGAPEVARALRLSL